ncbi:MAG: WYL domain-containing protein [Clostridia bacterium]|nr:WYL domain-containing protein [Clostridia bacterium]
MSHIARELKMLFYLNNNINRYVKIDELADLLEVTSRQVRRYRDDLDQNRYFVVELRGPAGGYKLAEPLDKSLMIPDNIMLALNIAAKNNESLIKSLKDLPITPKINKNIIQNETISDNIIDNSVIIANAINDNKNILFHYIDRDGKDLDLKVSPYKIAHTNDTYYLLAKYDSKTKGSYLASYDIDMISNIEIKEEFIPEDKYIKQSDEYLKYYGIKNIDSKETKLVLRYNNESILRRIDRIFEYKGSIDTANKTYTVYSRSENELFYPLFKLGTKYIEILNEDFKKIYINYLESQFKAIKL